MEMRTLVTKLLGPAQVIISATGPAVHVQRWTVFRSKFFDVCSIVAAVIMRTVIDVNRIVSSRLD